MTYVLRVDDVPLPSRQTLGCTRAKNRCGSVFVVEQRVDLLTWAQEDLQIGRAMEMQAGAAGDTAASMAPVKVTLSFTYSSITSSSCGAGVVFVRTAENLTSASTNRMVIRPQRVREYWYGQMLSSGLVAPAQKRCCRHIPFFFTMVL